MKKILIAIMTFVLCSFACCGASEENAPPIEKSEKFSISYRYWDEEEKTEISVPEYMWRPNGVYPTEYETGKRTKIDDLRHYRKDDETIYAFEGWYYDASLTERVTFTILDDGKKKDLTLYAKIVEREKRDGDIVTASITYKWLNYDLVSSGVSKMTENVVLPSEYVEGEGVTLPTLSSYKGSAKVFYRFVGWYYDDGGTVKIVQSQISKNTTGNVTVYGSIEVWVG